MRTGGTRSHIKVDFWLKSTFGCTSPILEKIGENGGSLANTHILSHASVARSRLSENSNPQLHAKQ